MEFRIDGTVIAVNVADAGALLAEVRARFGRGEGFALATINLDHVVKLRGSAAFRAAYAAQDLVVADGNPIVWLSHLAGRPVALAPGADMVLPLAGEAARAGVTVALVGSTEASLAAAAAAMERLIDGLEIVERIAPPMGFDPEGPGAEEVFAAIEASGAGLALLALGAPKQEMLARFGAVGCPLVDTRATFKAPCRYGDDVEITSEIAEIKTRSFDVKHTLTKKGQLCVEGFETRVWTVQDPERGLKSAPLPEELVARFRGQD